jgi:hypothetical protein
MAMRRKENLQLKMFCEKLSKLYQLPPSSAGLERIFSTLGYVWTDLRNRLQPETAEKLCQCCRFLREETKKDRLRRRSV